jgi:16S rRNA (cytosine1402-N4)-methyltransferase
MYHIPVMLAECLDGLAINPQGTYIDVTFGGGGHSKAILEKLDGGKLYAFDQDDDAEANAKTIDNKQFTFIKANFRHLKKYYVCINVCKLMEFWQILAFRPTK